MNMFVFLFLDLLYKLPNNYYINKLLSIIIICLVNETQLFTKYNIILAKVFVNHRQIITNPFLLDVIWKNLNFKK